MEEIVQGYCRVLDGPRTVYFEDGEADCSYPDCPWAGECPVAKKLKELEKQGKTPAET